MRVTNYLNYQYLPKFSLIRHAQSQIWDTLVSHEIGFQKCSHIPYYISQVRFTSRTWACLPPLKILLTVRYRSGQQCSFWLGCHMKLVDYFKVNKVSARRLRKAGQASKALLSLETNTFWYAFWKCWRHNII